MISSLRSWSTLFAALLLGAAIGFSRLPGPLAQSSPVSPSAWGSGEETDAVSSSSDGKTPATRTSGLPSKSAYASAWELLKDGHLPRGERLQLQCALLEEWCMLDLEPALRAALGELPDEDPFAPDPLTACDAGIASQLELTWELIQKRELGLHTHRLRWKWIETAAQKCPRDLIHHLPDLPPDCIEGAIHVGVQQTQRSSAPEKDQVITAALAFRGTPDEAAAMKGAAGGLASALEFSDLIATLLDTSDSQSRALYFDAYVTALDDLSASRLQAELENLPATLRAEVEKSPRFPKDPKPDESITLPSDDLFMEKDME